jgi:hypothetical protein
MVPEVTVEHIKNGNRVSVKRLKIVVTAVMVLLTGSLDQDAG